jgi:hypothetical protein
MFQLMIAEISRNLYSPEMVMLKFMLESTINFQLALFIQIWL